MMNRLDPNKAYRHDYEPTGKGELVEQFCSRCAKVIVFDADDEIALAERMRQKGIMLESAAWTPWTPIELCPTCADEFFRWLNGSSLEEMLQQVEAI